jgi:hypothetical protein
MSGEYEWVTDDSPVEPRARFAWRLPRGDQTEMVRITN